MADKNSSRGGKKKPGDVMTPCSIRMHRSDWRKIDRMAERAGQTPGEWMRTVILDHPALGGPPKVLTANDKRACAIIIHALWLLTAGTYEHRGEKDIVERLIEANLKNFGKL